MPLQPVLRPFADHAGIGKTQKAEQNVVVVDLPAAADHDEDRQRIDPMHDAHRHWMEPARCGRFGGLELDWRCLHRLLPRSKLVVSRSVPELLGFNLWQLFFTTEVMD